MRAIAILFVAFTLGVASAASKPFVGWLIDPESSDSASVEVWGASNAEREWRVVDRGGVVLARMKQPALPPGHAFNWGGCRVGGEARHDVIAVVRHRENQEWSAEVAAVWVVDAKKGSFVSTNPKGFECRNEGYGV